MTEDSKDIKPGAALGAQRELRGWSIQYICDQINLNKSIVIAIEADDYESLPPPAFVRGYIRSYAKLLEIESDTLVVKYEQLEMPAVDVVPSAEGETVTSVDPFIRMMSGLVVAVVLGALAYWWYNNRVVQISEVETTSGVEETTEKGDEDSSNTGESLQALFKSDEPTAKEGSTLAPGVSYERPMQPAVNNPNALAVVEVPVSTVLQNSPVIKQLSDETVDFANTPDNIQEAVALTQNLEAGVVASTGVIAIDVEPSVSESEVATRSEAPPIASLGQSDILLLKTESESWVSVIDAAENRLMYGILTNGTPRKLQGIAPFSIVLGAAPGIEATLNGSDVDFSSLIRQSNTARFVIEQTGETHR